MQKRARALALGCSVVRKRGPLELDTSTTVKIFHDDENLHIATDQNQSSRSPEVTRRPAKGRSLQPRCISVAVFGEAGGIPALQQDAAVAAHSPHIFARAYTPKTNGRAERFIQTHLREWAYCLAYP